jgi:hypothetical protein
VGGGYVNASLSDLALQWMAEMAGKHGLNLDLRRIKNPRFKPCILLPINNSQGIIYRIATILFAKLPGYIGYIPKKYKDAWPHIKWSGDYVRPITDKGAVQPFIGDPPQKPAEQYSGSLDSSVIKKIKECGESYRPENVV